MQSSEKKFREFYYGTYDAFYKYVRRMAGRESVAEDIVQESYCKAYTCWEALTEHPKPIGWLYQTAAYMVCNMRRRKENLTVPLETVSETAGFMCVADIYDTVEVEIMLQSLLSAKEWELLHKYHIEGYNGADIAVQMGISEESVRMRLSRIRRKLREKLQI